jgi:hypothetical protein
MLMFTCDINIHNKVEVITSTVPDIVMSAGQSANTTPTSTSAIVNNKSKKKTGELSGSYVSVYMF